MRRCGCRTGRALLLACVIGAGGCESAQKSASVEQALVDYDNGFYASAHQQAIDVMQRERGAKRDEAAYLAGLSAYQLGEDDEAELRWLVSSAADDPTTAGRSRAMLGLMRLEQGRESDATRLLNEAADLLEGDEARQARHFAMMAASGKIPNYPANRGSVTVSRSAAYRPGSPIFALQAGAFQERARAETVAKELTTMVDDRGMGPVSIIATDDDHGRRLFLVQFGEFQTRQRAAAARAELARLNYIVTPMDDGPPIWTSR